MFNPTKFFSLTLMPIPLSKLAQWCRLHPTRSFSTPPLKKMKIRPWKLVSLFSSFRFLNKMPDGAVFITFSFVIRIFDGIGGAMSMTAAVAFLAQCFPDNVGSIMVND
jgi:hypothetical protein